MNVTQLMCLNAITFFEEVTGEKTDTELDEKFIEIVDGFKRFNREAGK